jgi:hypothetical protein
VLAGTPEFGDAFEPDKLADITAGLKQDVSGARRAALLHHFLCLIKVSHTGEGGSYTFVQSYLVKMDAKKAVGQTRLMTNPSQTNLA